MEGEPHGGVGRAPLDILILLSGVAVGLGTLSVGLSIDSAVTTTVSLQIVIVTLCIVFWRDRRASLPHFFFTLCFALFLTGRQVSSLLGADPAQPGVLETGATDAASLNRAHTALFVALCGLGLGWLAFKPGARPSRRSEPQSKIAFHSVRQSAAALLLISAPAKIYALWLTSRAVQTSGFFDGRLESAGATPLVVRVFEELFTIAVVTYLVARPQLKPALLVCALYVGVGVISLQTLSRAQFTLNVIMVLLYLYMRQVHFSERIFTRRRTITLLALLPIVVSAMNWLATLRGRTEHVSGGLIEPIRDFIYSQGVSIKVILATQAQNPDFGEGKTFSLGPLTESLLNLQSLATGTSPFSGQTAARAYEGHQLSHSISYAIAPYDYLRGVGYGSSFVAELLSDFGLVGVLVGSLIYGLLLSRASSVFARPLLAAVLTLLLLRNAMFVPRASFVFPISELVSPASLLAFVLMGLALLANRSSSRGASRVGGRQQRSRPLARNAIGNSRRAALR